MLTPSVFRMSTQYNKVVETNNRQCNKGQKLRNLAKIRIYLKIIGVKVRYTQNYIIKSFINAKQQLQKSYNNH